jgi:hypothetical protein
MMSVFEQLGEAELLEMLEDYRGKLADVNENKLKRAMATKWIEVLRARAQNFRRCEG